MGALGAAGRRQGNGPEVRHFVQHGRLVHRAASEARPGGHDDRRRVRGRRVPGSEGHSGLGGPRRRGRRPRVGHDHQGQVMIEPIVASIDEEDCSGCRICNNMCPYNAIEFDEEKSVSRVITRLVQGLRHLRGRLPGRRHHRRALQQRADFRRDRRHSVGCQTGGEERSS